FSSEHIKSLTVTSDPANPKEGDSQVKLVATTAQGTGDVTWLLNGKPLPNDSRYEISGTSLVIKNVTCQDTGLYTCILKNPFSNDTFNKNITIFYGPENPQIVVTVGQSVSTENFVKVGDWLSLTCQAVGDPAPSYFWSSESQKNITGSQSGVLSLKNIQTNQSGVYTCVMTNPVTSVSIEKNYTVNVYASPSGDPICSVKAVQSNTALEYQCSWMGGTPLALLQFTLPNATQGGGYLNHTEVASPSLNGQNVTCIGTHPIVSKNCSIVAGSPDGIFPLLTTTMDSSGALVVTISCASTFLPQPTVQWSKNNQVLNNGGNFAISGDTSQLTISNFNINGGDLTTYTCNSVNPLGAKSNSMTLRGPTIGDSSLFPNKQGTIVTLTWETPRDSVITGFDIQMKGPDLRRSKRSTNEFTTLQMTGASNHSLDIFGLHPKSTYRFRIIPLAGQTQGAPSQEHRIGPGG
ncbi:VS10L protein, partial [Atractosteus spatula]|nr:VS10L protein [Atractosteus spatula]